MDSEADEIRRMVFSFLRELGEKSKISMLTVATAIIYFHRYHAIHQHFDDINPKIVSLACLLLATKSSGLDTPRKPINLIIDAFPDIEKPAQEIYLDQILLAETRLLVIIGFDFPIDQSYQLLLKIVRSIKNIDQSTSKSLAVAAWAYLNDSLQTNLCLRFSPEEMALSVINLAVTTGKIEIPTENNLPWYHDYKISEDVLREFNQEIKHVYNQVQPPSNPASPHSISPLLSTNGSSSLESGNGSKLLTSPSPSSPIPDPNQPQHLLNDNGSASSSSRHHFHHQRSSSSHHNSQHVSPERRDRPSDYRKDREYRPSSFERDRNHNNRDQKSREERQQR